VPQGNYLTRGDRYGGGAVSARKSPKVIVKRAVFFNDENDVLDFVQTLAALVALVIVRAGSAPLLIPILPREAARVF